MDIYDRDDSLFHNMDSDTQRELQWHDNVFGERIDWDAEDSDEPGQSQSDQDTKPTS